MASWKRSPERHLASYPDDPRSLIRYAAATLVLAVAVVWAAYLAVHVLLLVYASGLLATGLTPVVRKLERQPLLGHTRVPRWLAILAIYLVFLAAVALLVALAAPIVMEQGQQLLTDLPRLLDRLQEWLRAYGLIERRLTVEEMVEQTPGNEDMVGVAFGAVMGLVGGVAGLLTILVLTFYFLVYKESLFRAFVLLFPRGRRREVRELLREVTGRVSAWLVGQSIVAGIVGLATGFGLWALGVPHAFVLAVIAAFGEFLPILGPILASIPAIALALTESYQLAVAVTVFYIVLQQVESHLLLPRILGAHVHISPIMVIIGLLLGHALFGLPGAILAVPTSAILVVLFSHLVENED